jgi:hypothetical protein
VSNATPSKAVLKYEETRFGNILDNPSEYQCAVVRFNVPGTLIPTTLFDDSEDLIVKLIYEDCEATYKLKYLERRTPGARKPTYHNAIYSIQEWLDTLNKGFDEVFDILVDTCPDFPPIDPETGEPYFIVPPVFEYDPTTKLLSVYCDAYFYEYSLVNPYIKVQMNLALYSKMATFDSFAADDAYVPSTDTYDKFQQLMIRASFTDPIKDGFIKVTQEHISLSLLNDAHTIVFESAALPLNTEYIPATDQNRNITRPIVTDFLIPADTNDRSDIQFTGTGLQVRWIDLQSDIPLRSIDITGYWVGKDGKLNPLFIPPYDLFTMKLAFRKKPHYIEKREKHLIKYSIHDQENNKEEDSPKE